MSAGDSSSPPTSVDALLTEARSVLARTPFSSSPREAFLLLGAVTGRTEARLRAHGEEMLSAAAAQYFRGLLRRRLQGEPIAYLLGTKEFYGRPFAVDGRVLIPRPETEHVVEAVLALELPRCPAILDVGTGSGILAITLALELIDVYVLATDRSLGALNVARSNRDRHGVTRQVSFARADGLDGPRLESFDLVVSNPPYIDPAAAADLSPEITGFEPPGALFAQDHGRQLIARLLTDARRLRPGAWLVLEIGHDQADWLKQTVAGETDLELMDWVRDYGGVWRVAVLRRR